MNPTRRLELVLRVLAVVFVIVGAAALATGPSIPETAMPPADLAALPTTAPGKSRLTDITRDVETVLDANIFSVTRARPRNRYDPYGSLPNAPPAMTPGSYEPDVTPLSPEETVPRLFGTVVGPGGAAALLRLDPATPEARLYREGESGGRYRVVRILDQSVVLMGPNGSITLRLPPPPGDSSPRLR
jgi:hypothetical protein